MFCRECLESFHFVKGPVCQGCGGELNGILELCTDCLHAPGKRKWKKAFALFIMSGAVKEVIYRYKYRKNTFLAAPLGALAAEKLAAMDDFSIDIVTYIPLHWTRYFLRGYNQSQLLSGEIAKSLDLPVEKLLKRVKFTKQQAHLKRGERFKNVRNAFKAVCKKSIAGKKILLVDDVLTTGATLASAAEELLENGAAEIYIFVIARRHSHLR